MSQRLVLFGGTFDPIHRGHLAVSRWIADQQGFARITLVPAAQPPHKGGVYASARHRLAMMRLAVKGEDLFDICEMEIGREGPSYTIDTLEALQRPGVDLYWIIGADMLPDLPTWRRAGDVVDRAHILVASRAPWHKQLGEIFAALSHSLGPHQIERLRQGVIDTPLVDISSTDIRRRVREGQPIEHLVGPAVGRYITENGLYLGQETL